MTGNESVFQALSKAGNVQVALPTEEQWEKAARGTDGREYLWDGDFDANKANTRETGIKTTSAVGAFPTGASAYGLLDASGNVWKLIFLAYDKSTKVLRGGSLSFNEVNARCAYLLRINPADRAYSIGFRLVVVSPFFSQQR